MVKKLASPKKVKRGASSGEPILLRTDENHRPATTGSVRSTVKPMRLAHDGDPYVMVDGTVVQPENMYPDTKPVDVSPKKVYRPLRKRAIKELPAMPNVMKGIAVVFAFTVLGLTDRDIAEVLGITVTEVRRVRAHAGYAETFDIIASEFVSAKSQRLNSRIAAYADDALDTVHDIMVNGKKESNVLRAGIDMLDRAGVGHKDAASRVNAQQNELRITIVKGSDANVEVNGIAID
jgi:hypothetical protein